MRARLRLIRHGEAARDAGEDADPGLSLEGVRQAFALPAAIPDAPERLVSSPMRRARETAVPLANAFALEREICATYSELPWRAGQTVVDRQNDLTTALGASWSDLDPDWRDWRDALVDRALSERGDVVVVSHFVAINVLVGHALNDPRTVIIHPANTAVAEFAVTGEGRLTLVSRGAQMDWTTAPQVAAQRNMP